MKKMTTMMVLSLNTDLAAGGDEEAAHVQEDGDGGYNDEDGPRVDGQNHDHVAEGQEQALSEVEEGHGKQLVHDALICEG